ncbi:dCMP deaminase [Pseudomonas phage UNO-G1W1]|uniref:dCMP deaminase n=1 Tax=Pseudomonas phage UNO-G1W1 TaxID=3136609 RepID=A0AAX4MVR9_9CAUD
MIYDDKYRPPNRKYDTMHMGTAAVYASESQCPRTQVGCALVLASGVVSPGFNGMASGGPNQWEFSPDGNPEVVHAELNSLGKCLEQGLSTKGATMYVTLSPCLECSKLLVRAGVKRVVYRDEYRLTTGIDYLRKYNVEVEQYVSE